MPKILIIEDDEKNNQMLKEYLEANGYACTQAYSGSEGKLLFSTMGLQNLQEYPEARALLDYIYRYMDSPEFEPGQEIEWEVLETLVGEG